MVLLTGFAPYRETSNASAVLIESFADELPGALLHLADRLACEIIHCDDTSRDTEHRSLEAGLKTLLDRHRPTLCIHTGQAPPYPGIMVERRGSNSFMRKPIDPSRPHAYCANLPGADSLVAALATAGIAAAYSSNAGQHLCNHLLYSSLYFADQSRFRHRAGFIHIPILPEQLATYPESAAMPLAMSRKALAVIVNHVASADTPGSTP